jgi:outer membrane protein
VKKIILSVAAMAMIAGLAAGYGLSPAAAQGDAAPAVAKVGLIDMAFIFKNYKKFDALREDLKNEITQSDTTAKQMQAKLKGMDEQLKLMKAGSPDFAAKEKQLLTAKAEFESFVKGAQREFIKKESQIYKQIYLEVTDAVNMYAKHYQYTLIMRFNREEVEGTDEPQDVLQRMNRQVVYFRDENDITSPVLKYLNKQYGVDDSAPAKAPVTPTGGTAPRTPVRTGAK